MVTSVIALGRELLVQDMGSLDAIPRYGSFLLAPWVGELSHGRLVWDGRTYSFPRNVGSHAVHGLVFEGTWDVESIQPSAATLGRDLGPEWPFGGRLRQTFRLDTSGLTQSVEITAVAAAFPVSIGWHPWFACREPANSLVRVNAAARLELQSDLLPTGRVVDVAGPWDLRAGRVVAGMALDDVYVGASSPAELSLPGLTLRVLFDDAISNVVVYMSKGAVCLEPWSAWPDAAAMAERGHRSGISIVEPGAPLRHWMRWEWV